jgi:hypothetical protein
MKETAIIILIFAFYVAISYWVHKLLLKIKLIGFIIVCVGYALFTNYLFDFLIYSHQYLRSKGIYLEFGHADLTLLEVFVICSFIGLINIIVVIVKKYSRRRNALRFSNDAKK